jgi:hypothetical protein
MLLLFNIYVKDHLNASCTKWEKNQVCAAMIPFSDYKQWKITVHSSTGWEVQDQGASRLSGE